VEIILQIAISELIWCMKLTHSVGDIETPTLDNIVVSPSQIESEALKRILAEVVDGRDGAAMATSCYDRDHNRHNR
jgi:hypothetical protein